MPPTPTTRPQNLTNMDPVPQRRAIFDLATLTGNHDVLPARRIVALPLTSDLVQSTARAVCERFMMRPYNGHRFPDELIDDILYPLTTSQTEGISRTLAHICSAAHTMLETEDRMSRERFDPRNPMPVDALPPGGRAPGDPESGRTMAELFKMRVSHAITWRLDSSWNVSSGYDCLWESLLTHLSSSLLPSALCLCLSDKYRGSDTFQCCSLTYGQLE